MKNVLDFLICFSCNLGEVKIDMNNASCAYCKNDYPLIFKNIIDFRLDLNSQDDGRLTDLILKNYSKKYVELIELKNNTQSNASLRKRFLEVDRKLLIRNKEKQKIISKLSGVSNNISLFLELGCGAGSAIHTMSRKANYVIGVDLSLSQLLLANRILLEENVQNVLLVCASIDNLPLKDGIFDVVFASDVIEHVPDQINFLKVGYNKLRTGGKFIFNSPNRYSIFSAEPHTGVWFAGFFPRKLIKNYIYLLKRIDYYGKRLLSYFELKNMIKHLGYSFTINGILKEELEGASKNKTKAKILKIIPCGFFILNKIFKYFIPTYTVVIVRK